MDSLYSSVLATRSNPIIRFQRRSEICFKLADKLQEKLNDDSEFIARASKNASGISNLLILDRREDPITPMLN